MKLMSLNLNSAHQNPSLAEFRYDIQGLRAIAVLAVMIFHANSAWLPGGFTGVDIFFVISGFIVSRSIIARTSGFDFLNFYFGRLRRIVPAYVFMLLLVAVAAAVLLVPKDYKFFQDSFKAALYFVSNQYFSGFGDYFAPVSNELPLLHTWSLAIEMQFYLVLPILMVWLPRTFLRVLLPPLIVLIVAWSTFRLGGDRAPIYYSFLSRSAEFFIGVWLACFYLNLRLSAFNAGLASQLGTALLVASFFVVPEKQFPGIWVLLPCFGAFFIILGQGSFLNRALGNRHVVYIGALSYSLYLWHWPILAFIRYYTQQYDLTLPWLLLYCFGSFALAAFTYHYIETPFRQAKSLKAVCTYGATVLMATLAVLLVGKTVNSVLVPAVSLAQMRYADDATICHGKIVKDCLRGAESGVKPTVLVIGDSHAAQLNFAFDVIGKQYDIPFKVLTASSCVPIQGFDVERLPDWSRKPCLDQIKYVAQFFDSADVVILAGKWHWQTQSPMFLEAFKIFLTDMQKRGVRLIVLGQVPMLAEDVGRLYRFSSLGFSQDKANVVSTIESNEQVGQLVSQYTNASFIDVANFEMFQAPPIFDGKLIYSDSHHLNEAGALAYGNEFGMLFEKLMGGEGSSWPNGAEDLASTGGARR